MNSVPLPLRVPISTILKKPGFGGMGYQAPFQNEQEIFSSNTNPQIVTSISSENSQFNIELNRGIKSVPGPSMSTPLNIFQTNNCVWQPERLNNGGKSTTNSLNIPFVPQRFSSYSQMPYSSVNVPLQTEFKYNSLNKNQNIGVAMKSNIYGNFQHNLPQSQVSYPIQPQILAPQMPFQYQQNAFQFQNQQNPINTGYERHMGIFNHNKFVNSVANTFNTFGGLSMSSQNSQPLLEHAITRMNTFNGNLQPQIFQSNINHQNSTASISDKHKYQDQFLRADNFEKNIGNNYTSKRKLLPVTSGTTIKGYKPTVSVENQDKSLIIEIGSDLSAYAVFDGHGPHGDVVADFVSNKFSSSIMQLLATLTNGAQKNEISSKRQQIKNFFIVLFHNMDLQLSELKYGISLWSGCTAAVCIRIHDEVHIAWVGDSRVVIFRFSKSNDCDNMNMESMGENYYGATVSWWTTSDHVPNRPDELNRITDCGASITIYPTPWLNKSTTRIREHGIAMSRSFGDKAGAQFGVICRPDMASIKLTSNKELKHSNDRWAIVVASDGIWDSLSEEEVGYKIMKNLIWKDDEVHDIDAKDSKFERPTREEVGSLASNIATEAWKFRASVENYSDDTTLIISII